MTDTMIEPERIFPPVMVKPMAQPAAKIAKVTFMDLDEIAWVLPSLQKSWPRLTEEAALTWFRDAIGGRFMLFLKTKNAVGMASFNASHKEPMNIVSEEFIRAKDGYEPAEILLMHKSFAEWAIAIGAKEYVWKTDSPNVGTPAAIRESLKEIKGVISVDQRSIQVATLKE